jgi:hypothetical protein
MVSEPRETAEVLEPDVMAALYAAEEGEDFPKEFPLSYAEIAHRQATDPEVQKLLWEKEEYKEIVFPFGDVSYTLVTKEGKIVLSKALQKKGVTWYYSNGTIYGAALHLEGYAQNDTSSLQQMRILPANESQVPQTWASSQEKCRRDSLGMSMST